MTISVLQWNVLYREKGDNILRLIKEINADIVCLQELTQSSKINPERDLPAEIKSLGYYAFYEPVTNDAEFVMGNGIFSRFPIVGSRTVFVSSEDPTNKDYAQSDRAYVESTLKVDKTKLTIGTVHLSYSPRFIFFPAKKVEAKKFIDVITPNKESFILTGDFNATPDSELIKELDSLLVAVGPDYSNATWTTKPFELHGFSAKTLDWRLDYIFASRDIKVLTSKVIDTNYSDHLPVLAEVEI
jgi:endonuclease/exonuclease/phosphatase family metal-dependent hydrolase